MTNNSTQSIKQNAILSILFLGFSSGLAFPLSGGTLQAWMTTAGIDLKTLGWTTLLGFPYLLKFLWAPALDRYVLSRLGRRRSWILLMQALIAVLLVFLSLGDAHYPPSLKWMFGLSLMIAWASATQDIAVDAHRTELLGTTKSFASGNMTYTLGYRIALLCSGALGLILADHFGFPWVLRFWACVMLGLMYFTLRSPEPLYTAPTQPLSFVQTFIEPAKEFLTARHWKLLLLFIPLYKLGDAFASSLATPFYMKSLHFTLTEIGVISKTAGFAGSLIGVFLGGTLVSRVGSFKALISSGILQCVSIVLFAILAWVGHHYVVLGIAVFTEQLCSGVATAAFTIAGMQLCHPRYTASQYAVFSALASIGRVLIGPYASYIAEQYGWVNFFFFGMLLCLPGLLLLIPLKGALSGPRIPQTSTGTV